MLERYTIDRFGDAIATEIEPGDVSSTLLRRFYRQGRSTGRRGLAADSYASLVIDGVDRAISTHMAAFFEEQRGLVVRRHTMSSELSSIEQSVTALDDRITQMGSTAATTSATDDDAALRLQALAAKNHRALVSAVRQDRAESRQRGDQLAASIETIDAQLIELASAYVERVEASKRAGQLCWDRFCTGFEAGRRKRGRPDYEGGSPLAQLAFRTPPELAEISINNIQEESDGD